MKQLKHATVHDALPRKSFMHAIFECASGKMRDGVAELAVPQLPIILQV